MGIAHNNVGNCLENLPRREKNLMFFFSTSVACIINRTLRKHNINEVKSVQSTLNDLLTTSATHGTFSRPSTKGALILIGLELNTNARESFEHC